MHQTIHLQFLFCTRFCGGARDELPARQTGPRVAGCNTKKSSMYVRMYLCMILIHTWGVHLGVDLGRLPAAGALGAVVAPVGAAVVRVVAREVHVRHQVAAVAEHHARAEPHRRRLRLAPRWAVCRRMCDESLGSRTQPYTIVHCSISARRHGRHAQAIPATPVCTKQICLSTSKESLRRHTDSQRRWRSNAGRTYHIVAVQSRHWIATPTGCAVRNRATRDRIRDHEGSAHPLSTRRDQACPRPSSRSRRQT